MPLREIHAPGARRPSRVTPKAIAVLATLAEQGGRVVSRDVLLATVWPGTLPTDDVVTQAITQLRKAFGDERGNPRYIETIAKNGYRLLPDVDVLDATGVPGSESHVRTEDVPVPAEGAGPVRGHPPAPSVLRGDWRAILGAIAVAGLLVSLMLAWSLRHEPPRAAMPDAYSTDGVAAAVRLITSIPGVESSPSLSPDAALVAYVAIPAGKRHSAIMVQTTNPSSPRQLSHPGEHANDSAPAWSPDGREIAFLRTVPGKECQVLVMPVNGGAERAVGTCDPRNEPTFDWTADGGGLVFGSRGTATGGAGIRLLDLATGEWRLLDFGATARDMDILPRFSPDGRWIVFVRNSPVGDLWRLPATGGTAQRLTRMHADIRGWDWMPDGRAVVLSRWSGSESRLWQVDLETGATRDLGISDGFEPSTAAKAPALAFVESRNYFGIHRVQLGGTHEVARLLPSSGRDRLPTIGPDGHQLVFTSDRAGQFGVWWSDLRQADSLRLIEGLRPETRLPLDWSHDSRCVLVVGEGTSGLGLHEVALASGRVTRLASPEPDVLQGLYVPGDPKRLLVVAGAEQGHLHLRLYDRRQRPWRALATLEDVAMAQVDRANRRVLFARPGQPGLWQSDLDLSPASVRQIDSVWPEVGRYRSWAVSRGGEVYFLDRTPECATALRRLGDTDPRFCVDRNRRSGPNGFSISPDGDVMYITLSFWDGGDIGFTYLPVDSAVAGSP